MPGRYDPWPVCTAVAVTSWAVLVGAALLSAPTGARLLLLAAWTVTVAAPTTFLALHLYLADRRMQAARCAYRLGRAHAHENTRR